jgi:glyceraldehyde 3-phosphate dehydrogenase
MTTTVAINGFGRIGRNILRQYFAGYGQGKLRIAAINDLTDAKTLAHLLMYDSVHGRFKGNVSVTADAMVVNGETIKISAEKDPAALPWKNLGIETVLECSGAFTKKEKAAAHLKSGARKVIISAPSPDADATFVVGVNHTDYRADAHHVVSCASCTTNCLAPVAKVIAENFGVVRGSMTTIHSYTNDQRILDLPHKDLRRARAAALSMIPTSTGAAKAIGLVLPSLAGKLDGFAIRVPTADVSVVDFVAEVERETSVEEVNRALRQASEHSLKGVLDFCTEPLVSVDFIGSTASSTVDALSTMVIQQKLVKVVAWYDNEMGFSARMIDLASFMSR